MEPESKKSSVKINVTAPSPRKVLKVTNSFQTSAVKNCKSSRADQEFENPGFSIRKSLSTGDINSHQGETIHDNNALHTHKPGEECGNCDESKLTSPVESKAPPVFSPLQAKREIPAQLASPRNNKKPNSLSQKEKEDIELEEIKRYRFKARPVPKKILELPDIPVRHRETQKKSKSLSPLMSKKIKDIKEVPVSPIKVQPFSFFERDKAMKIKKENKIKHQMEEEKKRASMFRARPVPATSKKKISANSSASSSTSENAEKIEN